MIFLTFEYYSISLLLSSFIALISGFFVYYKGKEKLENISWLFLNVSTAIWSFGYYNMISAHDHDVALFSNWILHGAAILIPIFYFFFITAITQTYQRHKFGLLFIIIIGLIFSFINPSKEFVQDVYPKFIFNYAPDAGPLYSYFALYFFGTVIYALWILSRTIIANNREEKQRLKFVLFSSLAGFIGGGSVFLLTFNIGFPPYPIILFALYPIIIAYAILRHHLFDVRVIATEFLVFSIWIFLLVRILLGETFREQIIDGGLLIFVIISGALLIRSVNKEVRQRQYIEKLMKQRSEFLDVASHQLRTPVSVILGTISLFQESDLDKLSKDQKRHFIDNIYHKARKLANIVNDLLEASEMDTAEPFQLTVQYIKPTDPQGIIKEVIGELRPKAEEKGLRIEFNPAQNFPLVRTDPERLEQALTNLIDNAVKYTQKGLVRIGLSQKDGQVIIAVSDSGIGIPEADKPKIFEKFARAKNAASLYTDGSGLGLFIVKAIIEAHEGGKIWFESEENKGTTFYVSLPAYQGK